MLSQTVIADNGKWTTTIQKKLTVCQELMKKFILLTNKVSLLVYFLLRQLQLFKKINITVLM